MSRSVLLQLARDSIQEVFQAQRSINASLLLQEHPLLNEKIPATLNLFINRELKGSYTANSSDASLLENIILSAKKAAFEDENSAVLTTSSYLYCEIELVLSTAEGEISETDPAILRVANDSHDSHL